MVELCFADPALSSVWNRWIHFQMYKSGSLHSRDGEYVTFQLLDYGVPEYRERKVFQAEAAAGDSNPEHWKQ